MKYLLIALTIFVLWMHFVRQIDDAYHWKYISVAARTDIFFDQICHNTPKLGWDWRTLSITEYAVQDYCEDEFKKPR